MDGDQTAIALATAALGVVLPQLAEVQWFGAGKVRGWPMAARMAARSAELCGHLWVDINTKVTVCGLL